jgi:hypothetical protein
MIYKCQKKYALKTAARRATVQGSDTTGVERRAIAGTEKLTYLFSSKEKV